MKREYSTIEELIKKNLSIEENIKTMKLIKELKHVKKRGYFTKEEFIKMGMWKSPRAKQHYLRNIKEEVKLISKEVLATEFEKRRMELLDSLKGVSIPTASAILTLIDPQNYGVIDIRVWQTLYLYGSVKAKPIGINLNFNNWYNYLVRLRYYSKKLRVSARDIERTIFYYHRKIQEGRLYKI